MKVDGRHTRTIWLEPDGWSVGVIDQTKESSLMHRYGTIEEQVAPILFLASDRAAWMTGETIPIDGGRHLTCAR